MVIVGNNAPANRPYKYSEDKQFLKQLLIINSLLNINGVNNLFAFQSSYTKLRVK